MNLDGLLFIMSNAVWPLCFLLIVLTVLHKLSDQLAPIFTGMISSLAIQAKGNAGRWALGMMLGTLGSLQALGEVATAAGWHYVAAFAKVTQPGLSALIAFILNAANNNPSDPTKAK